MNSRIKRHIKYNQQQHMYAIVTVAVFRFLASHAETNITTHRTTTTTKIVRIL